MLIGIQERSAHRLVYRNKLRTFALGIEKLGDQAKLLVDKLPKPNKYDAAVIYGSYKEYRTAPHHRVKRAIAEDFIKHGKHYIQFETPVIGRSAKSIDHGYIRVGVDGFLWDTTKWGFDYIDESRAEKVFTDTGYDIDQQWKTKGDHVLVALQNPGDASLRGTDIMVWGLDTVIKLRRYTDRPIIVRPHPLPRKGQQRYYNEMNAMKNVTVVKNELPSNLRPLEKDFNDAWCVVTFASGSAVDAVLAGIPSIACDSGNMAWEVSSHLLSEVENPYRGSRKEWINKIVHCQFSVKELEDGTCWEHVRKTISTP